MEVIYLCTGIGCRDCNFISIIIILPVCVPDVIGALAVWRHNNQEKTKS